MRRLLRPNFRFWVISTLLVTVVVRALIPAGFMPAADRPFSFQICPDGFPAALLNDTAGGTDSTEERPAPPPGHHHHAAGSPALADRSDHSGVSGHAGHHHF